jgi:protein-S-isoprenylcysteine O-methyltransferase Ste14
VCGVVGATVTVALLLQMDRTTDSVSRQATIGAIAAFIGDTFSHPSHFPPQWAEPMVTAAVSGAIAIALWYAKRFARSVWASRAQPSPERLGSS